MEFDVRNIINTAEKLTFTSLATVTWNVNTSIYFILFNVSSRNLYTDMESITTYI
jgi:hypothetical protein